MKRLCNCTDSPQISALCICSAASESVRTLTTARLALADVYTPAGVRIWLNARNKNLDGQVPIRLILAGDGERVIAEARRVAGS